MKKLKFFGIFLCLGVLASCVETEEKIVINANESGNYTMTMDLSKMIAMVGQMGSKGKKIEKRDSTIYFKNIIDTAKNITPEEKEAYRDASFSFKVDDEKSIMKIVMDCPFKNISQVPSIKGNFLTVINKLQLFEKLAGENKDAMGGLSVTDKPADTKSMDPFTNYFDFSAVPGKISNTIRNKDSLLNLIKEDSSFQALQQMSAFIGDFTFRTVIVSPEKIKKFKGPDASLSEDKKTITFKNTLSGMFKDPEAAQYSVEYK